MKRLGVTIVIIGLVVIAYAWQSSKGDSSQPSSAPVAQKTAKPDYLHLRDGDITKADYRAGVKTALKSPVAESGGFLVCAGIRGISPLRGAAAAFGNQIPITASDMAGWIAVPGQRDDDAMYLMIAQTIINDECGKAFKP
jgi:hypothetical protein